MKFEKVRIDFKVTLLVCCRPKILLPRQRDVTTSPLYYNILKKGLVELTHHGQHPKIPVLSYYSFGAI